MVHKLRTALPAIIAVIGLGISGCSCCWSVHRSHGSWWGSDNDCCTPQPSCGCEHSYYDNAAQGDCNNCGPTYGQPAPPATYTEPAPEKMGSVPQPIPHAPPVRDARQINPGGPARL